MGQRIVVQQRMRIPMKVEWLPIWATYFAIKAGMYGVVLGGRYLSGRPLDGRRRTNATFLQRGTSAVTEDGQDAPALRPSRWSLLPGWQRAGVRVALPATAYTAWSAYAAAPELATAGAGTVGTAAVVRAAVVGRGRLRTRRFRRIYLAPLSRTVGPLVGIQPWASPEKWLTITPDLEGLAPRLAREMSPAEKATRERYTAYVEPVLRWAPDRIMRGYWWTTAKLSPLVAPFQRPTEVRPPRVEMRIEDRFIDPALAAQIDVMVRAKLGLSELDNHWDQVGKVATGVWTVRKRPPEKVKLAAIAPMFDSLPEHKFIVGFGPGDKSIVIDLDDDSPHIACSAGSGAGKSVLAMDIAIQVLRRGGRVTILDRKGSHRWARGLTGVTYCTKPADMHAALIGLASLADSRNSQAMEEDEGWDPGPRHFVIFEEMNATIAQLRTYWENNREKDDPKTSPAIQGFRDIMYMGRSAKVNLFGVAQMLTANTTGGPEARENFGVRFLARYTANNWKMLAPECAMPRKSKIRGRWQVVIAGKAHEVQVAFSDDIDEIRGYATPVVPVSPDTDTPRFDQPSRVGTPRDGDSHGDTNNGDVPDPFAAPITLKEALEMGIIQGGSEELDKAYETLRKRIQRAEKAGQTVPTSVGQRGKAKLYRAADLIEWSEQTAPA